MEFYTQRNKIKTITIDEFYIRFCAIIEDFIFRDYFKEKLHINEFQRNFDSINRRSVGQIGFKVFPIDSWSNDYIKENYLFDAIEFLLNFVSEPGEWLFVYGSGSDYKSYDSISGRKTYVEEMNHILLSYKDGYELSIEGEILFKGDDTKNFIETEFSPYDLEHIDNYIHKAIKQWKSRNQSLDEKKQAIINLANVFEYLKKEGSLDAVLNTKDSSDLFNIANNFELRHHNKLQKPDYDVEIWYDWMIQFYLATCTTALRLIKKSKPK
jgi:hypothetical protein